MVIHIVHIYCLHSKFNTDILHWTVYQRPSYPGVKEVLGAGLYTSALVAVVMGY